jgi:hypothetical protein
MTSPTEEDVTGPRRVTVFSLVRTSSFANARFEKTRIRDANNREIFKGASEILFGYKDL